MNPRTIVLALACALLLVGPATAGVAVFQQVGTKYGDNRYFADEPNVGSSGCVGVAPPSDPSRCYPADSNGIGAALDGDATVILNSKWLSRAYQPSHRSLYFDSTALASDLGAGNYLFGAGQFVAWYGVWADVNGDGTVNDAAWEAARGQLVYVQVGDYRNCGGALASAASVHVVAAGSCGNVDEWTEAPNWQSAKIFSYVTPSSPQDMVNNMIPTVAGGAGPAATEVEPDFSYQVVSDPSTANAEEAGKYYSPVSNFDFAFNDNSLLQTTVVETLVNPLLTVDQPRIYNARSGMPTDVDLYNAVDASVEALYAGTVNAALTSAGLNPDDPDSFVLQQVSVGSFVIGPVSSQVLPVRVLEDDGRDHEANYHFYFDVKLHESAAIYGVALNNVVHLGEVNPDATGGPNGGTRLAIGGNLGVWKDINGDGFVGNPEDSLNCPGDPYQCGAVADPNEWSLPNSFVNGRPEWIPTCNVARVGEVMATLTPDGGSWGLTGAYVLSDRYDATRGGADTYMVDGRGMFSPWEEIVLDVANDGDADSLVFTGSIPVHLVCIGESGFYASYEEILLPGGNRDFGITVATAAFDMTKVELGIEDPETNQDTDYYAAWTLV